MQKKYKKLKKFYEKNFDKIYNYYFFRLRLDVQQAEDLTQAAFLRALEKLDLYNQNRNFDAWFWKLSKNLLIDYIRQQKQLDPITENLEIESNTDIEKETDLKLKMEHVYEHLEKLPDSKKELILLYYISDVPVDTIAELYETTTNNIRVQLSRIIKQLSTNLKFYER